ncbi:hypothetical protein KHA90_18310 [Flavobacterium psychroterrae]|uniref:Uncharacterized protein n=1 Tax=Flavobacterium psychroterrae TaxID=2133767 RepID=A0ABS5PF94_9FLAO|nr:hypothetical protein [Flavobacterium psychroterrae]MBS7232978.1 hypothetical protein [Flavobacterium psychroterrae]
MKKYASLILFALLLNGCDDGDLTVDTIDFDDTTITSQTCDPLTNNLIYRLKPQESLLIQLPDDKIINDQTIKDQPLVYDIDNSLYRVVYRAYDGTVATANICGAIPPTSPKVTEEWQATAGQIVIISQQNTDNTATDGSSKITGYTHNIAFRNITFLKPSGPQVEEEFNFGNFVTAYTSPSTIYTNPVQQCSNTKQIYNFNTTSALTIDNIDPLLIVNEITPTDKPRTGLINATTNKVLLRSYINGTLTQSYFCGSTIPSSPAVNETWIAQNGSEGQSGIIQVTTTKVLNTYTHNIVLKSVKLVKGNSSFNLATNYILGNLEVTVAP